MYSRAQAADANYGSGDPRKQQQLGNRPGTNDAFDFRGGGYVQITGRAQYARMQSALAGLGRNVDLVNNPGLAADPSVGLDILIYGIRDNVFAQISGKTFDSYLVNGGWDFYNARDLINGDKGHAREYLPEGKNTQGITSGDYVKSLSDRLFTAIKNNPYCGY